MRAFTRLSLCCSAAIVALSASAVLADQQIGNVVQKDFNGAKGLRVASLPPPTSADDLLFNHDVFAGETVKTASSASTVIRFQDQTQIQVGANSSIVLDSSSSTTPPRAPATRRSNSAPASSASSPATSRTRTR